MDLLTQEYAEVQERFGESMKAKNKNSADRTYFQDVCTRFFRHKLAVCSLIFLLVEVLIVVFIPMITGMNPYTVDSSVSFGSAPTAAHLLGTDSIGRDNLARLLYGGRVSLYVGFFSTVLSALIGVPLGLMAGFYRSWIETVILRCAEVFQSIPSFIIILVLVAIIGPSVTSVMLVIGIMGWPKFAKLLYGNVIAIREKEYVEAAKADGIRNKVIIFRYILPNAVSPALVAFTFGIANAILQESSLSFLGMGVQPPQASWGNILYEAQSIAILAMKPWFWIPAGVILMATVLAFNFFGDGLRDALDPKMKV